jgi:asparagine synthase (glutamine-hydrolysing)
MCGIYGIVDLRQPIDIESLKKHRDRMVHRGPDDKGIWVSDSLNIGFGHRRLSIIDLSPAGHQPMVSTDGRCVIIFNGEVYNFKELRSDLELKGCRFRSGSDTEVVLEAYKQWGETCIQRFNGMFALAIYDKGDGAVPPSLFFARDRAGKKPFYYVCENGRFQFGSELKALDFHRGIDINALNYYLALGYVPGELCLARGVKKLPPAHAARLDIRTLDMKIWKYWELPANDPDPAQSGDELADQAEELLDSSVGLRLISDVPLGVLLSGGLDSSLIVASAARQSSRPVKTFTISLPGSKLDESSYARIVADYFGTDHHVLEASDPSMSIINEMTPFIDEPIADSSLIPTFLVSQLTRKYVTVALGGDGGDELFGGYLDYPTSLADERITGWIPPPLLKMLALAASGLPAGIKGRNRLASLREGALQQMIWGSPYFDVSLRRRILNGDQLSVLNNEEFAAPEHFLRALFLRGIDALDCMTRTHFGSILPDDFLVKVDRASMAHSLEMRTPFLDYRLVEFAFSKIPSKWKVKNGETRRIQKILSKRMLPPDLDTKRKQGFSIPLDEWLRKDHCRMINELLPFLPEEINRQEVNRLIAGHMRGRANGARLYALIMLAIAKQNHGY